MLFVHVVTGPDLLVTVAQIEGQVGITFQIRPRWNFVERRERKHFATDLENKNIVAEWRAFGRLWFAQAIFAKFFEIHSLPVAALCERRNLINKSAVIELRYKRKINELAT